MARTQLGTHLIRTGIAVGTAGVIGLMTATIPGLASHASASSEGPLPFTATELRAGTTDAFVSRSAERSPAQELASATTLATAASERATLLHTIDYEAARAETERTATARTEALSSTVAAIDAEAERVENMKFFWPTEGSITSPWGPRLHPILKYTRLHGGADIGGALGAPIYAVADGVVTKAATGHNSGSGNNVRIDHGVMDGEALETSYLHMHEIDVEVGQTVKKGQRIGSVGSTGLSTAPHLHFSVYVAGVNSDPAPYLNA